MRSLKKFFLRIMKMKYEKSLIVIVLVLVVIGCASHVFVKAEEQAEPSRLGVLWTSGDADVAHKVCFMYTHNAKEAGWFDEVKLIIWGPSSRLLAGDKELQARVKEMMESGVDVKACKACADMYGVSQKLSELGIDVKYMGGPLTNMLKGDWKILTF